MANSLIHTHTHSHSQKNYKIYHERQRMAGYHTHHGVFQAQLYEYVCVCVWVCALANGTQQPPCNLNWRDNVAPSDHFVRDLNTSFAIHMMIYVCVCVVAQFCARV